MEDGDISVSDYHKILRGKATTGMEQLKQKLSMSPPSSMKRNIASRKPTAYSASVDRLKGMIDKYESQKTKGAVLDTSFSPSLIPQPDELAPLLNDQHTLLQHLEGQVDYYKDSLSALKHKAELVIEENSRLHDQLRCQIVNEVDLIDAAENKDASDSKDGKSFTTVSDNSPEIDEYHMKEISEVENQNNTKPKVQVTDKETMTENVCIPEVDAERDTPFRHEPVKDSSEMKLQDYSISHATVFKDLDDELDDIKALYASKTQHLESLLYTTRNDLDESQQQVLRLQTQLRSVPAVTEKGTGTGPKLCIKCAQNEAVLGPRHSAAQEKVIERLEREKEELMDAVNKQRKLLSDMRKRELEAYTQVKKSCELVEQSQLEKHEIIVQHKQLKQELGRQHERYDKIAKTSTEILKKEKQRIEDENRVKLKVLENKIDQLSEQLTATEVQLERVLREKVDLKSELERTKAEIIAHETEITNIMDGMSFEVANAVKEKALTEQENQSLQQENKQLRNWKERKLDSINSEFIKVKQKLQTSGNLLESSKEECIKLFEELNKYKKQAQMIALQKNSQEKRYVDETKRTLLKAQQREQELRLLLRESEHKYVTTKEDLSGLLESQIQIAERFKQEYKKLAEKLEHFQQKHSEDINKHRQEIHNLQVQIDGCNTHKQQYETEISESNKTIQDLRDSVSKKDKECKQLTDKVISVMDKQNTVMKERQLLCSEVEFLRTQLPGIREEDLLNLFPSQDNLQ